MSTDCDELFDDVGMDWLVVELDVSIDFDVTVDCDELFDDVGMDWLVLELNVLCFVDVSTDFDLLNKKKRVLESDNDDVGMDWLVLVVAIVVICFVDMLVGSVDCTVVDV